ncbi:hypothetical protein pdam_00007566 [Pocillopora damicornis]|uniref:MAM domain-containing protein n=1 Tax=Pocillopora damicornis TaxID=46731 RepID=A0A3M6V576_POCDA|nr:hypothetical protein pdam_00007566 [Pocillopora damicornis]
MDLQRSKNRFLRVYHNESLMIPVFIFYLKFSGVADTNATLYPPISLISCFLPHQVIPSLPPDLKQDIKSSNIPPRHVIIEGVAGISNASNIAVDDVSFSKNLSCVSDSKITPEETFEVNCAFNGGFCGWRSLSLSSDQVSWKRAGNKTGHSGDFGGNFIYTSRPFKENQSTHLLSPLMLGPKCFRFSYHMSGWNVGRLDILLQVRRQQGDYLMWKKTGDQGNRWIQGGIGIGYTGEFQIVFKATPNKNYTSRIALDSFILADGLCDDENELDSSQQGNCNFDQNFCFWKNDSNSIFKWTLRGDRAPKYQTGPSGDHTSGKCTFDENTFCSWYNERYTDHFDWSLRQGSSPKSRTDTEAYIYIETSSPRMYSEKARLNSPWKTGPQRMEFFYSMYGSSIETLSVYVKINGSEYRYFGKEMKEDWTREIDIVQGLSINEEPQDNLLHYRWHSKASEQSIEHGKKKIHGIQESSWLICYDFESNSTLEDFLSEKGVVIDLDAVCAVACDVITAIEHLLDHGIAHNNITTGNILIRQCSRVPPIKAVLGGFSQASMANKAGAFTNSAADEQSYHSHDIKQFGHLLATLLGHCHGSSEYVKLHEIMNLCFEDIEEKRPTACYIREVLEETWCAEGVWDTYL